MERKSPIHVLLLRWTTKTTRTLVLALARNVLALITHPKKHVGDLPILCLVIWMVNRSIDKGQKLWWQSQDGSEDLLWVHCTSIINLANVLFNMTKYLLFLWIDELVNWTNCQEQDNIRERVATTLVEPLQFCYSEDF